MTRESAGHPGIRDGDLSHGQREIRHIQCPFNIVSSNAPSGRNPPIPHGQHQVRYRHSVRSKREAGRLFNLYGLSHHQGIKTGEREFDALSVSRIFTGKIESERSMQIARARCHDGTAGKTVQVPVERQFRKKRIE